MSRSEDDESSKTDHFAGYHELDVSVTADRYADLTSLDVNGTQLILKQHEYIPVLVEIYVDDEEVPLGAFNIAKGETVTLGGVNEGLTDDAENIAENIAESVQELSEIADEADALANRINPTEQNEDAEPSEQTDS